MIPEVTQNGWTFQRHRAHSCVFYGCYHKDFHASHRIREISIQFEIGKPANQVFIHALTTSALIFRDIVTEDHERTFRAFFEPRCRNYSFVRNDETRSLLETLKTLKSGLKILRVCDSSVDEVIRNVTLALIFEPRSPFSLTILESA